MSSVHEATNPGALAPSPPAWSFWGTNSLVWSVYAGSLMVPWLDRYSVLEMLPNKIAIASIGVAVSGGLRAVYRWLQTQSVPPPVLVWLSLVACVVGAFTFDATVIAVTQGPEAIPLRWGGSFGALLGGVPMPGRILQYTVLLVAWSLAWQLFTRGAAPDTVSVKPATAAPQAPDATLSVIGSTLRARDGSRTILLERDEVEWIAADGDYVRVYCGSKSLLIRATMKQSSETLAALGFVRVHRSAIVNPRHVREIVREGNDVSVVLKNGARVRAGRNYAGQIRLLSTRDSRGGEEI
jgi:hypothetical protein